MATLRVAIGVAFIFLGRSTLPALGQEEDHPSLEQPAAGLVEALAFEYLVEEVWPFVDPTNPQGEGYYRDHAAVYVENNSSRPIWFAIKNSNELQGGPGHPLAAPDFRAKGWFKVNPGGTVHVKNCKTRLFYWYAKDDGQRVWKGEFHIAFERGGTLPMRKLDMGAGYRKWAKFTVQLTAQKYIQDKPHPVRIRMYNPTSFPQKYGLTPVGSSGKKIFELAPGRILTHTRYTKRVDTAGRPKVFVEWGPPKSGRAFTSGHWRAGGEHSFVLTKTGSTALLRRDEPGARRMRVAIDLFNNTPTAITYKLSPPGNGGKETWTVQPTRFSRHTRFVSQYTPDGKPYVLVRYGNDSEHRGIAGTNPFVLQGNRVVLFGPDSGIPLPAIAPE